MYIVAVNVFIIEKITSLIDNQLKELKEKLKEIFFQEYDDVDFQSNSIMKSLIPNGFCFQYISYNKCNKPMCKYRHDVPSKVWHAPLLFGGYIRGLNSEGHSSVVISLICIYRKKFSRRGFMRFLVCTTRVTKKRKLNYNELLKELCQVYILRGKILYYPDLLFDSAFDIYYKLLELNFHGSIPTKCIMKLLSLTEEDYDVTLAFSLISHTEKIRSIEYRHYYPFYK